MRLHVGDAFAAALETAQGFRWKEYSPFFLILATQVVFLALATQLHHPWAMAVVAPVATWFGGAGSLHYPIFYGYLSVLMAWVEAFLYAIPGSVLIPLAILRLYARTDRALSLGAGAFARLAGAVFPTLLAGLAGVGCLWGWQRWVAPAAGPFIRNFIPGPSAVFLTWVVAVLGGYLTLSLLLYIPVAAVQARSSLPRAIALGLRFGVRALPVTLILAVAFGLPAIGIQYFLERQSSMILTKLRPETIAVLLAVYAAFTSIATYLTYGMAARLYRMARGDS
ncbi:MAG TPA: hypothetical protein VLT84_02100 [Acidobacteriota bacterium]|nr:hypothetical protein [Acidobacteriota bacterium]